MEKKTLSLKKIKRRFFSASSQSVESLKFGSERELLFWRVVHFPGIEGCRLQPSLHYIKALLLSLNIIGLNQFQMAPLIPTIAFYSLDKNISSQSSHLLQCSSHRWHGWDLLFFFVEIFNHVMYLVPTTRHNHFAVAGNRTLNLCHQSRALYPLERSTQAFQKLFE